MKQPSSLRGRLLRLLWWPLLVVLVLSAVYDYRQGLSRARDDQDLALRRVAIALASRLDVDADDARDDDVGQHLARTVAAMQHADAVDRLQFLVVDDRGRAIGGDLALADLLCPVGSKTATYSDQALAGQAWRVVNFPHLSTLGDVRVLVAETVLRRQAQARQVMLDTVVPNAVLLALALALVRWGVATAMRPLDELDSALARRARDDLSPLPVNGVLMELLPLVEAINQLMAHLRNSAQEQQAFLSNAAHQLRTPLAGVQMQLELARQSAIGEQATRLETAQSALMRMARATHQMLALARSGPQAYQAEWFQSMSLQSLLEECASIWLDTALASGVELVFDAQPAMVNGSGWMLHELLGNLIHNAIKHTPSGLQVLVRCGSDATTGAAWLRVDDQGPGVESEVRARMFERFYRPPGAPHGGTGLGLAIVQEVAQRHGACITLPEAESGGGFAVKLVFPRASSDF